jgi:hypothetical protein
MPLDASSKLRVANTILAVVVLMLMGQAAYQVMRVSTLKADLAQARLALDHGVDRMATEKLKTLRREELVGAVQWLHEFYKSPEGLQRPGGLWRTDTNTPDAEAIGAWIFDVYLHARLGGASDDDARKAIADAIRGTDEWRQKHPKKE